jgi:hypothetical protein
MAPQLETVRQSRSVSEEIMGPTSPSPGRLYIVLLSGLATSALTLLGVYWLSTHTQTNVMGWYANYVIPAGAVLVGLAAASGYGFASWLTGVKISRGLLWSVLLLQLASYFGAQYVEFWTMDLRYENGKEVGFVEYLDFSARSFAWENKDGTAGQPLGAWGYVFRFLELVGFAAGGLVVPFLLRQAAYCEACQMYMRTRELGLLPAGILPRKVKKNDLQDQLRFETELKEAQARGDELLKAVARCAAAGQVSELRGLLDAHASGKKECAKLIHRITVSLSRCPRCASGIIVTALVSGQGQHIARQNVGSHQVGPGFVTELVEGARAVA